MALFSRVNLCELTLHFGKLTVYMESQSPVDSFTAVDLPCTAGSSFQYVVQFMKKYNVLDHSQITLQESQFIGK